MRVRGRPGGRRRKVVLTWNDRGCLDPYRARSRSTRKVNTTGWLRGLEVTADGTGIVSHAGVALLRALADKSGLTAGLSKALASRRLLVHDRGRVLADLACAIADGAEVISDFRVMADQGGLFGAVASVPTCWRQCTKPSGQTTAAAELPRHRGNLTAAAGLS